MVEVHRQRAVTSGVCRRGVDSVRVKVSGVHVALARDRPTGARVISVDKIWSSVGCRSVDVEVVIVDHWLVECVVDRVVVVADDNQVRVLVVHFVGTVASQTVESGSDSIPSRIILVCIIVQTLSHRGWLE